MAWPSGDEVEDGPVELQDQPWPALQAHAGDHFPEELSTVGARLCAEGGVQHSQGGTHHTAVPDLKGDRPEIEPA